MARKYFAEFIGTFVLVFAGTSAIVVNDMSGGTITHVGVAIVFGLVVTAMIYTLGDISGAHINPAVTLAFWFARRFPGDEVLPYIISQVLGAISASIVVYLLFFEHPTLGATVPSGTSVQSFVLETLLAFILMLTIINVATGSKEKGIIAGMAIGSVVAFEALFAGPISGASMNPARSIGPALVSGNLGGLWIYIIAPILGAFFAILCCRCVREKECCTGQV
ncbi:MAG TPA: MIP family channel protein [Gammaproteobacteria bacterium]